VIPGKQLKTTDPWQQLKEKEKEKNPTYTVIPLPGEQHAAKHDQAAIDARRRQEYYPRAKLFSEERMREQVCVGVGVGVGVCVCVCVCVLQRVWYISPLRTKQVFMHEANMRSMCVCVCGCGCGCGCGCVTRTHTHTEDACSKHSCICLCTWVHACMRA